MSVRLAFNKQDNFSHGIGTLFQPDMILQDPLRQKKRVLSKLIYNQIILFWYSSILRGYKIGQDFA